jgi:quinoprotein relay system zinc metallohydrolase 2
MGQRRKRADRRRAASRRSVCCGLGAAFLCCLPALRAQAALLHDRPLDIAEIAPGLHVTQGVQTEATPANLGAIANIGFIIGRERVAVIDSGGCRLWGERLREAVRQRTDLPISHLILTHMHPDHIFGAAAFLPEKPEIIGHRNLPAALARRAQHYAHRLDEALGDLAAGSVIVPPTRLVAASDQIDLGGRVLELQAHGPAHTDNDLSLFDRSTGTLWAGDLVFMERVPSLDGSLLGWLKEMEALGRVRAKRVVPGHGPRVAGWPDAQAPQQRYLGLLRDEIRAVLRSGGTMEQAIATVGKSEASRWLLFDDYNAGNVTAAFHELEWE